MKKLGGFGDVFKSVKHRKPCAIYCPRCASPKIRLSSTLSYWLTPQQYYCENCGYVGIIVMELEEEKQETKEKEK
jgi:hypothetical protein